MSLTQKLYDLRKGKGMSQEALGEKLGVSRQTVSKWENGQTVPELSKAKLLCELYCISYEYLINEKLQTTMESDYDAMCDEIDWTSAWSKRYPILASYKKIDEIEKYSRKMSALYDEFKEDFEFSDVDAVLILKDILYHKYKESKTKASK